MTTSGNDLIYGTLGSRNIDGRGGTDTVTYERLSGNVLLDLGSTGRYVYKTDGSSDSLVNVEAVSATNGLNDVIFAAGSNYSINVDLRIGNLRINSPVAQNMVVTRFEHVWGSGGDDRIIGNSGDNFFAGNEGADILTGGGGSDTFSYNGRLDSTGSKVDTITDFASGWDKIDLRCFDADPRTAGRQSLRWMGSTGITPTNIRPGQVAVYGSRLIASVEGGLFEINIANPSQTFAFENVTLSDLLL